MTDWADEKARAFYSQTRIAEYGVEERAMARELRDVDRAAYERGVREAADCCDDIHTARIAKQRILALLDKEGGGDG